MPESRYAKTLERATAVFGRQRQAENWLQKPCKYLDNHVPLTLIDSLQGFQMVNDYLARIEYGVYS